MRWSLTLLRLQFLLFLLVSNAVSALAFRITDILRKATRLRVKPEIYRANARKDPWKYVENTKEQTFERVRVPPQILATTGNPDVDVKGNQVDHKLELSFLEKYIKKYGTNSHKHFNALDQSIQQKLKDIMHHPSNLASIPGSTNAAKGSRLRWAFDGKEPKSQNKLAESYIALTYPDVCKTCKAIDDVLQKDGMKAEKTFKQVVDDAFKTARFTITDGKAEPPTSLSVPEVGKSKSVAKSESPLKQQGKPSQALRKSKTQSSASSLSLPPSSQRGMTSTPKDAPTTPNSVFSKPSQPPSLSAKSRSPPHPLVSALSVSKGQSRAVRGKPTATGKNSEAKSPPPSRSSPKPKTSRQLIAAKGGRLPSRAPQTQGQLSRASTRRSSRDTKLKTPASLLMSPPSNRPTARRVARPEATRSTRGAQITSALRTSSRLSNAKGGLRQPLSPSRSLPNAMIQRKGTTIKSKIFSQGNRMPNTKGRNSPRKSPLPAKKSTVSRLPSAGPRGTRRAKASGARAPVKSSGSGSKVKGTSKAPSKGSPSPSRAKSHLRSSSRSAPSSRASRSSKMPTTKRVAYSKVKTAPQAKQKQPSKSKASSRAPLRPLPRRSGGNTPPRSPSRSPPSTRPHAPVTGTSKATSKKATNISSKMSSMVNQRPGARESINPRKSLPSTKKITSARAPQGRIPALKPKAQGSRIPARTPTRRPATKSKSAPNPPSMAAPGPVNAKSAPRDSSRSPLRSPSRPPSLRLTKAASRPQAKTDPLPQPKVARKPQAKAAPRAIAPKKRT